VDSGIFIAGLLSFNLGMLAAVTAVFRVSSEIGSRYGFPGFLASIVLFPISGTVGVVTAAVVWEEHAPLRWLGTSLAAFAIAALVFCG
jgi:hypothetical protein